MALRIGVLVDSFDPFSDAHLKRCNAALSSGDVDQVLLIPTGEEADCTAPAGDRWRMLVAACAGSRVLIPFQLSRKHRSADPDAILSRLQDKFHEDQLILLSPPACPVNVRNIFSEGKEPDFLVPAVLEYCLLKGLYGTVPRLEQAGQWVDRLFETLNPHRFSHTLSVALTSVRLAAKYHVNVRQAEEAGLLHDCAKCLPLSEMQRIARRHHLTEDPSILESASLLHSVAGAWVARSRYGMKDPEVLEAIAYHNTGHEGMSRLAMCVCLADFMEPNREPFPLLNEVRLLAEVSLEKALLLSLEGVADHVRSKGKLLHPRTLDTIEWLKSLPAVQADS